MSLKIILLILLHEFIQATEQILFKKSVNNFKLRKPQNLGQYFLFIKEALTTPLIWLGFLFTAGSWLIWLMVLASLKLSIAIILGSIHYIIIFLAAYFILKEKILPMRIIGTLLILFGILLVAIV